MKKYILMILLGCLFGLAACYDDESTLATEESRLQEIVIGELSDTSVIAFSSILNITPEVSGFTDDELTCAWYIYGGEYSDRTENGYRTVKIGEQKTLNYEVKLKQGTYNLVFEATSKKYGYTATQEMKLEVYTPFSQGFYILKETAEGNTELDIYNIDSKELKPDILALTQGSSLAGGPRELNTVYSKACVDPETATPGDATMVFVAYGENGMVCFRTEDMVKIFDRSSLLFGDMSEDEIPYCMATGAMANYYFSSKGVRTDGNTGNSYGTGKLGYPDGGGGSTLIQACDGRGLLYWDGQNHRLMYAGDGGAVSEADYTGNEFTWDEVEAIATGWNNIGGTNTVWYILETKAARRYLIFVDKAANVTEVRLLNASLHIARGGIIAGNGKTSYSIYAVDNRVIYRYNIEDGSEAVVSPQDLPENAEITYLSDIYFSGFGVPVTFDYMVIGVQDGLDYNLYLYNMVGGLPYGAPVYTVKGRGTLKQVRWVSGTAPYMANLYAFYGYSSQDFPY